MTMLKKIYPEQPLENLRWFDMLILAIIMFGQFIYSSTVNWLSMFSSVGQAILPRPEDESLALLSNLKLQVFLLVLALLYLGIRHYDFKQLKLRLSWSILWAPLIFAVVGLTSDLIAALVGSYNYFDLEILRHIDWTFVEVFRKLAALGPVVILYSLFNGVYEEFFFLGLLTSVKEESKWWVLVFSTLVRFSVHTYQGLVSAFLIGMVFGLFYYFFYKYKVKNLLPFFLAHAFADMVGSSLLYVLVMWNG